MIFLHLKYNNERAKLQFQTPTGYIAIFINFFLL